MKTININGKDFTIEELSKLIEDSKNSVYPIYCELIGYDKIVKFTDLKIGALVKNASNNTDAQRVGQLSNFNVGHDDKKLWKHIPVCPETGFFHGQLVWAWDDNHTHLRVLAFYDTEVKCAFPAAKSGYSPLHYDYYASFEGNWPDWALEAYKTLEL